MTPKNGKTVIFLRGVDRRLHSRFKSFCARSGQTMKGRILQLIQRDLKGKR